MAFVTLRGSTAVIALVMAGVTPVLAQDAPAAEEGAMAPEAAIIVTGSRIKRVNVDSAVPVTSVSADELQNGGNVSIGDALNGLPQLRSTFSQANSTRFIGTAGLNMLDLRGLGTPRTLVLVNGRRHVPAQEGNTNFDTNTIPADLIERVDIVTGGTSAVYGSDAVSGVVNFVLKRNFEGLQARAQGGISDRGDRGSYFASLTAGTNFADDRGNIAFSGEYARQHELRVPDRPDQTGAIAGRNQFQITQCTGSPPNALVPVACSGEQGSDGVPDRTFYPEGIRSLLLSEAGTFLFYAGTNTNNCSQSANPLTCFTTGPTTGLPRIFTFNPDGTAREIRSYGVDLRPVGSGNTLGGEGSTLRRYGQLQPAVERISANILGSFEISPGFKPYFEAKYVRVIADQESSPTFAQGGNNQNQVIAANSQGTPIRLDNAFLTDQARSFITARLPAGQTSFRLFRNNLDFGIRGEHNKREIYRAVVGIEGDFNGDWHYDLSANYGRLETHFKSSNNRIQQRFELAADAVRNAAGQIVCRAQITPPAPLPTTTATGAPIPLNIARNAALASDIAACVPINMFGEGAPSRAALDYVNATTERRGRHSQFVAQGFVSGDLSQLFELPGGPVGFAAGLEYRRETASAAFDTLVSSGQTFLNAIPAFAPPAFEVKEAFAEINIPLLRDRPFFHELSFQGAGRVADYNNASGTVFAWNAGATWAPIEDVRLRGNYSVAVRTPNLAELYTAPTQNFAAVQDPCDVNFIGTGTATRATNCLAAGIPAGFQNFPARAATIEIASAGNPGLTEERSKSLTIGAVIQPRAIPGLSLTVDYYAIKITNVIANVTTQNILNSCYDAATLNNIFCPLVQREAGTNFFARPGVINASVNFAALKARGVDIELAYTTEIPTVGRLNLRMLGNYVQQRDNFTFLDDPGRPDQVLYELGDPRYAFNFSANLKTGPVNIGYQMRWFDKQYTGANIEEIRSVGGRTPTNADSGNILWYPDTFYHDLRVGVDVNDKFNFYAGVDNMFDKLPPLDLMGNGNNDAIFDNVGRFFYAGIKAKF